jgi:hypothetical protein
MRNSPEPDTPSVGIGGIAVEQISDGAFDGGLKNVDRIAAMPLLDMIRGRRV